MEKIVIITGNPQECETKLTWLKGKVIIESVETKFGKYGVDTMAIVARHLEPVHGKTVFNTANSPKIVE